jgi:hypothetical protein
MKKQIFFWSLVSALAGFLFGFDTVVISGAEKTIQSLGSFTHWFFAALLTTFFPTLVGRFASGYVFLFFCGMMVLQLIWVKTMVPETKGVALEHMQERLGVKLAPGERAPVFGAAINDEPAD